ncbi:MAG: putative dual-specificity RNA methyltransferase RlmN [Phycisphaerae bacterium]|nr:putative dual-specificity RNA methyltransferase RlmN [Phycisphaerae bacterium]
MAASPPASDTQRTHLLGQTLDEMRAFAAQFELEPYRAAQLRAWIFQRGATAFDQMSDLSKTLRAQLDERAELYRGTITRQTDAADGVAKLLITWPDGAAVETVWIPEPDRHTACISSQVGCPVGCRFCASGLDGVERNLSAGEIVEQAMRVRRLVTRGDTGADAARLSNVVLMGMGEPLANYEQVVHAIRIIMAPDGMGISARRITLSTVGLPAQIRRLAGEHLAINLALSLHAPDDDLRRELIPWGKGVPIAELIDACREYFDRTGREITLEYVLLAGVNDLPAHALRLAELARRLRCNVNLLRYNPVPTLPFERPSAESAFEFQSILRRQGVNAHVRTSRGRDANAACGQLRRASLVPLNGPGAA